MTSDRPYRRALSKRDALAELVLCSGSQFDPTIANMLINIIRGQKNPNPLKSNTRK
jgi:HD-GYP domain-containing protein (c-di-GMP phosphodiesterase class II)